MDCNLHPATHEMTGLTWMAPCCSVISKEKAGGKGQAVAALRKLPALRGSSSQFWSGDKAHMFRSAYLSVCKCMT